MRRRMVVLMDAVEEAGFGPRRSRSKRRMIVHAADGSLSWLGKSVSRSWYLCAAIAISNVECNNLINCFLTFEHPIFR